MSTHFGYAPGTRMSGPAPGTRVKGCVLYQPPPPTPLQPQSLLPQSLQRVSISVNPSLTTFRIRTQPETVAAATPVAAYAHGVSVPLPAGALDISDKEAWRYRSALRRVHGHGDAHLVAHKCSMPTKRSMGMGMESTHKASALDGGGLCCYLLCRPAGTALPAPASIHGTRRVTQPAPPRPDVFRKISEESPGSLRRTSGKSGAPLAATPAQRHLQRAATPVHSHLQRAATPVQSHPHERRVRVNTGDADGKPRATTRGRVCTDGWSTDPSYDDGDPEDTSKDNRAVLRRIALWQGVD